MRVCKQSTARNVMVLMIDSADHITGKTGLTLTITASKDGAAFAGTSPTVTDRGSGWYNLALTTTDTNTLGDLALHITGTGADPQDVAMQVVAYDPIDATALGLSRIDAAITSRMATFTQPTGFLAATFPTTVASTTNITAGTITTVTNLTNAPTAGDLTATMKTSVTTAATAATPTVAAVTAGVTVTTNNDKTGYTLTVTPPTAAATATAVLVAAAAAPIAADAKKMNGATVNGTGVAGDLWRGA